MADFAKWDAAIQVPVELIEANPWKDTELAWLAGIVDGEGAVYIDRHSQSNRKIYGPNLRVDMTSRITVDAISDLLLRIGVSHQRHRYDRKNIRHRAAEMVVVRRLHDLKKLLPMLLPFLVTKRKHADLLLRFVDLRLAAAHRYQGGTYASTYTGEEAVLYQQSRVLNRRGR